MNIKTELPFRLKMDSNKLDSKIKSFEYNGNHYLYVCHLKVYSAKPEGHPGDQPNKVKVLVKSFYGKYLDFIALLDEFDTNEFYKKLMADIDAQLLTKEPSY